MVRPVRLPPILILSLALACSRTTEFIGRLPPPVDAGAAGRDWGCGIRCFRDPGVPAPEERTWTGSSDPTRPELIYPLPGSLHPINLGPPTFQWRCDRGREKRHRIRAVAAADPTRRYDFYVPCRPPPDIPTPAALDECTYPMPAREWAELAGENRDAELTFTIEVSDPATTPPRVAASDRAQLSFSPGPLEAGIYYYVSGPRGGEIARALVGAPSAQTLALPEGRFRCAGCHAVSRDGRTVAFTADERNGYFASVRADAPGTLLVSPPLPPQIDSATLSLSPDGSLAVVSHNGPGGNGQLVVRDTVSGREVERLDPAAGHKVFFPEWSPDGLAIAATLATRADNAWTVSDGSIAVIPYQGGRLGAPRTVVPSDATLFHFHPSWSPDARWIVFVSAPLGGTSYHNPQARLRMVSADGARLLELARAMHLPGKTATWPRFAPITHAGGDVLYISFDSDLDYGYLRRNSITPNGGWPQLWLAAIDLRRAGDPSSAPVWLPFQRPEYGSLLGVWTERLACGPQSPCGEGTRCESGRCVAERD
jgi:hypothetical protein